MNRAINFFNLNLDHPVVKAKFGQMYQSFFSAITDHGWRVIYSEDQPSKEAEILVVPMGGGQEYGSIQAMRCFSGPVILYVPPAAEWFDQRLLKRISRRILFAYGTDHSTLSIDSYAKAGITYHALPFAADPDVMKPLHLPYQYDVVFVGSLDHAHRRSMFIEPLINALEGRSFLCIGSGWQIYNIPEQLIASGPLLNIINNLGRVCINIHTEMQVQGKDIQLDLNNRVFDLAMAGCCQVCDNTEGVREFFNEDEIALADTPSGWIDSVLWLLNHPSEAEDYRQKALHRAINSHTWHKRAGEFIEFIERSDTNRCMGHRGEIRPTWRMSRSEVMLKIGKRIRSLLK